jgi:transcriptional regulator with XRE-family HTH domain
VAGNVDRQIVDRVRELFESRGLQQKEFAVAIGVSPSWVSAFFGYRRPANDIHLLMKIARFFRVSVGYLLSETERARDADATTLLSVWPEIPESARRGLVQLALQLSGGASTPDSAPDGGSSGDTPQGGGTTRPPRKRR